MTCLSIEPLSLLIKDSNYSYNPNTYKFIDISIWEVGR